MKRTLVIIAACSLAFSAHATCYTVYNSAGKMIHQSSDAPVDTRLQYHMTVPQRFGPGSTLVYVGNGESCSSLGSLVDVSGSQSNQGERLSGQSRYRPKADRG